MTIISKSFQPLTTTLAQRGASDGVALEAPIVAFGFLQHLPEGALPLTGLLRSEQRQIKEVAK